MSQRPDRLRCLAALLAGWLCIAVGPAGCSRQSANSAEESPAPRLVVLVCLDTLRADRLVCYGHHRDTSPNLDRLAEQAVRFTTVGAQVTHTLPSHKSIFTSKYPLRLMRETNNADLETLKRLRAPRNTLFAMFQRVDSSPLLERLRSRGYRTVAFTDGAWISRATGFHCGFDQFNDEGGHFAEILPRVFRWLDHKRELPAFVFVHTYDTHCPYPCREPYNSMFCHDHSAHVDLEGRCGLVIGEPPLMDMQLRPVDMRAINDHYDGGVASADAYLGELLAKLRELKQYDEALIIVTSDHGEGLGEHGEIGHGSLYLEQLLVPLIIKFPASWRVAPMVIDQPVELLDVMPTILEACGVHSPIDLDGHSLLPLVREGRWGRQQIVAQMACCQGQRGSANPAERAILQPGRWLLIHNARDDSAVLFELSIDEKGLTVASRPEEADITDELMEALAAVDRGEPIGEFIEPQATPIDEQTRRQLESLGYVAP